MLKGFLKIQFSLNCGLFLVICKWLDLILLDIMMPDINGFEVCKKLKSDDKTKNIPIIFLSGKDSTKDIEQAYEVGGIDYVVKPFINIELVTKANNYVKLKLLEESTYEK
jgi:putative two-component system response regulator